MRSQTEQLALFEREETAERPQWHRYRCPRCGDVTESEIKLIAIRCPRCKRWYPAREVEDQD